MMWKLAKSAAIGGVVMMVAGVVFLGGDVLSYMRSSARAVQTSVKDSVPLEFEIQRARDMAEQIVPELQANIRLIAQEEVEVIALAKDIAAGEERLAEQRQRLSQLRDRLETEQVSYNIGGRSVDREQLVQNLADQFSHYRHAEDVLAGKRRLLETREASLAAAMQMLEKTRRQKDQLAQQIAALEGQHRLVQAAAVGSRVSMDNSKLARTQNLIDNIKKRLDVAERVLTHEAAFVQQLPQQTPVDESQLLAEMYTHLDGRPVSSHAELPQRMEGTTAR